MLTHYVLPECVKLKRSDFSSGSRSVSDMFHKKGPPCFTMREQKRESHWITVLTQDANPLHSVSLWVYTDIPMLRRLTVFSYKYSGDIRVAISCWSVISSLVFERITPEAHRDFTDGSSVFFRSGNFSQLYLMHTFVRTLYAPCSHILKFHYAHTLLSLVF